MALGGLALHSAVRTTYANTPELVGRYTITLGLLDTAKPLRGDLVVNAY